MVPLSPAFMGGLSPPTVPACLYRPARLKMVKSLVHAKSLLPAKNFIDFSQTVAVSISAYRRPIKKPKKT
jgi:hypothetical protein